ncbi:hypothetical protein Z517_02212 [Fonsecaea pedrosoi CBS 271.37]|uniref:AB hydrolase-1 domain-containing protein n=1 Tax=Fonsecaea pedrosoi CBS 271.37 TaxID=1442368 RepID=A0A0D2HEV9_9EURO|nr:uncharacterized protein Z517_02212 [Fonsecaea pedrosoi CBS 271.37]KIW82969.1 hypothetical protein Z517_02212 [Fonsecaea pedrosoi CBS 271.37]
MAISSDVSFITTDGVTLRGNLVTPDDVAGKLCCVILTHGFTCVKEMGLIDIATHLSSALPLACLVYDHRGFGASDTAPAYVRGEIIPSQQVLDLRDAITFASTLSVVDPDRIALWGYSYAGGHSIQVAASDQRVKCLIVHAPCIDGVETVHRVIPAHNLATLRRLFAADRINRIKGEPPGTIPVVTPDEGGTAALASQDSFAFFHRFDPTVDHDSSWVNKVTLRSLEEMFGYVAPLSSLSHVTPTPILMGVALKDTNGEPDMTLRHYSMMHEPKELCLVDSNHYGFVSPGNTRDILQKKEDRDDVGLSKNVGIGRWLILRGPEGSRTRNIFGTPQKLRLVFWRMVLQVLFDLHPILEACGAHGIKVLVSSDGGAGTNSQVDFMVGGIREIADPASWGFRIATITFDAQHRGTILSQISAGKTRPCGPVPELKPEDVDDAACIVAQMGAEPFLEVLRDPSIDIIMAGRSLRPGSLCGVLHPQWRPAIRGLAHGFVLTPTNPNARCTPLTVAAHTMYEKTRPDRLPGPGRVLYLDSATYLQEPDGRSVVVQGAEFRPTRQQYEVKLEGARKVGFRSIFIGGIRDPFLNDCIDDFLGGPQLFFHLYGKNAVMGPLEMSTQTPHEIGVLREAVAQTPKAASALAEYSRTLVLHGAYKGQLATAGNLASPLTPLESDVGPVFEFSLYHLMEVDDPKALFPIHVFSVGTMTTTTGERSDQAVVVIKKETPALTSIAEPGPRAIRDLAAVVRSKNSGPFEITLDILFANDSDFERARKSNVLTAETVQELYRLKPADDIITLMFFEPALGRKCTFKRPWPQGSIGERDTFGTQLHAPLFSDVIP